MDPDIYDRAWVASVFDPCSALYRHWSAVASFGMIRRWRAQCVAAQPADAAGDGIDLMADTGVIWPHLLGRFPALRVTAIDISSGMHAEAMARLHRSRSDRITHREANWLSTDLPDASADFAVSTFGLKALAPDQRSVFARRLAGVLRPRALYALIEATAPIGWSLRPLYRRHPDGIRPLIERLAPKGAQDFTMIGTYTRNVADGRSVIHALRDVGLAPHVARPEGVRPSPLRARARRRRRYARVSGAHSSTSTTRNRSQRSHMPSDQPPLRSKYATCAVRHSA